DDLADRVLIGEEIARHRLPEESDLGRAVHGFLAEGLARHHRPVPRLEELGRHALDGRGPVEIAPHHLAAAAHGGRRPAAAPHAPSSGVVSCEPAPMRTPPWLIEPESTTSRFEPRLWICSAMRACAPEPTETIAMTAATPMMMPSMVSTLRSLFTRRARTAMR